MANISDGTSNTYLIGERYMNPDCYTECNDNENDDEQAFIGFDGDVARGTYFTPKPDTPGIASNNFRFESAHGHSFHMAFCDGSVQQISYTIDATVHKYLGSRNDVKPIDAKKLDF